MTDDALRSFWTAFATGMGESTFGPGSASSQGLSTASSGEPRPGSLRFAHAGPSALTGGFNDGYLLLNPNRVSVHHIGSTGTGLVGHAGMWDFNGGLGNAPLGTMWAFQATSATTRLSANKTHILTYGTAYNGIPFVWIGSGNTTVLVGINATNIMDISKSTFASFWSFLGHSDGSRQNNVPYYYVSLGTVPIA